MSTETDEIKARIAKLQAQLYAIESPSDEAEDDARMWAVVHQDWLANQSFNWLEWRLCHPNMKRQLTGAMRYVIDGLRDEWEAS